MVEDDVALAEAGARRDPADRAEHRHLSGVPPLLVDVRRQRGDEATDLQRAVRVVGLDVVELEAVVPDLEELHRLAREVLVVAGLGDVHGEARQVAAVVLHPHRHARPGGVVEEPALVLLPERRRLRCARQHDVHRVQVGEDRRGGVVPPHPREGVVGMVLGREDDEIDGASLADLVALEGAEGHQAEAAGAEGFALRPDRRHVVAGEGGDAAGQQEKCRRSYAR